MNDRVWQRRQQPLGVVHGAARFRFRDLEQEQAERGAPAADANIDSTDTRGIWGSGSTGGGALRSRSSSSSSGSGSGRTVRPGRRRRAAKPLLSRAAATAVAVALVRAAVAEASTATSPVISEHQHQSFRSPTAGPSSRLCSPAKDSRAYVTTIAAIGRGGGSSGVDEGGDRLLGARVLAQSLRSAGAKGDVVVLVPAERATGPAVDALSRDGLKVQIVPRGLRSDAGEIISEELMTKVSLWSLTSYDRVVFLDPRSLIQKNPDALFACEGFCAAGAVYSPSSSPSFRPSWVRDAEAAGSAVAAAPLPLAPAHGLAGSGGGDDDDDGDRDEEAAAAAAVLEKPLSVPPSWQPSTSVMVLEPSQAVHAAMLDELARTPSVGGLEAQVFLSSFLLKGIGADAGDLCTQFEDPVENAATDLRRNRDKGLAGRGGSGGGWEDDGGGRGGGKKFGAGAGAGGQNNGFAGGGGGGGSFLEEALMPVVLLNGPHVPRCSAGRKRTADGVCQRLPYTFAAPSTDFHGKNRWGAQNGDGVVTPEPHIVHFADEDTPWKRLAYLNKPLFWKWNAYREQLEYPDGNFFAPWVLFFIPCVVLAFARVYYKTTSGGGGGDRSRNRRTACGSGAAAGVGKTTPALPTDDSSPSKSRTSWLRSPTPYRQQQQQQLQVAILPACRMAAAYDGAATAGVGSMEAAASAAARFRNSAGGGVGGGTGIAVGADRSSSYPCFSAAGGGEGQQIPVTVCYALSVLVGGFGLLWFREARALARELVNPSWHPVISVSVQDAWLCCALVLGLYVMDYLYHAVRTGGRTLLKDSMVVAAFVAAIRALHSVLVEGGGSSGGGGGVVIWASAIGAGVVALGFGHGNRAGVVHHLSGRTHFRCVTASCVVGAMVSLAMCWAGPSADRVTTPRVQSAAATVQMVFVALVYASVIGGARLRSNIDEAGSKISRSCSSASFVSDALIAAAPGGRGAASSTSSPLPAREPAMEGGEASGVGGGGGRCSAAWSLVAGAAAWTRDLVCQRRRVAACVAVLALWKMSSVSLRQTNPARHFEKYGQSCLESQAGFVEAGGKRLSRVCGAEQALRPVATGAYFEAFRQDKLCLGVAGGGFLTLGRVHVAPTCLPEYQFVFQEVEPVTSSKTKGGGGAGAGGSAADNAEYCVYNPASGFYLSAQGRPKAQCGPNEHWRVRPAPLAPGLKGGGPVAGSTASGREIRSVFSVLLHPSFLSRGPLHTFYGYLLAATALLVARAVFSKLATCPYFAATGRGGGGGGSRCTRGASKHPRSLGSRQRSRGRAHSRSHSSLGGFVDSGYFGDAGYAGDAETGGGGYSGAGSCGNGSSSGGSGRVRSSQQMLLGSLGSTVVSRGPSVSPMAAGGQRLDSAGWGAESIVPASRGDGRQGAEDRGGGGAEGRPTIPHLKRKTSSYSAAAAAPAAPAAPAGAASPGCDGWLAKVFSGLVVLCDATLLAGLWCLVPAHFAQAMSALTRDHHSAIDKGLGMDSNAAPADSIWSRSLGEGVGAPARYAIAPGGGSAKVDSTAAAVAAFSCDNRAWWLMSALVRWHLLFLLVAFCHLHGAVNAASVASTQRWRNRRWSKKTKASSSSGGAEHGRSSGSFCGLRSGERLAMRLRTAMGVLTLLLQAALLLLPERCGLLFAALHAHPGWGRCAPAAGLDESWGVVSPLVVFAVLAATCGVYLRAGSCLAVRFLGGVAPLAVATAVAAAAGREYLLLALTAVAMDWAAWAIAGVMSCVCYQSEGGDRCFPTAAPRPGERESSGSTCSASGDFTGAAAVAAESGRRRGVGSAVTSTGASRGRSVRHRINEAARRLSPKGWAGGLRGRRRSGGRGPGEAATKGAVSNL